MTDWVFYICAARTVYCGHGLLVQTMHRVLVPTQTLMRQTNAMNASIHTDEIAFTLAMFSFGTGHTSRTEQIILFCDDLVESAALARPFFTWHLQSTVVVTKSMH